jgi:hypothetical protein
MRKNILMKISAVLSSAIMAVTAGTFAASAASYDSEHSLALESSDALAGKIVNIDLDMVSGNLCDGYTISVEYDSDLQFKRVNGGATYAQDGNIINITGFTPYTFEDGKVASISFEVPEDAKENEIYDVRIVNIKDFGTLDDGNFDNVSVTNAQIKVKEAATKTSNYMVFVTQINQDYQTQIGMRGDVNNDGKVDIFDAIVVAQSTVGKTNIKSDASKYFGNVNEDESFDIFDAISIARYTTSNSWVQVIK